MESICKRRTHTLDTGKRAIENSLPYIRFSTFKDHNIVTFVCLERDHWKLTDKAIEIFKGFPISFGDYNGGEYSFVKICEILPMVIPPRYLALAVREVK